MRSMRMKRVPPTLPRWNCAMTQPSGMAAPLLPLPGSYRNVAPARPTMRPRLIGTTVSPASCLPVTVVICHPAEGLTCPVAMVTGSASLPAFMNL